MNPASIGFFNDSQLANAIIMPDINTFKPKANIKFLAKKVFNFWDWTSKLVNLSINSMWLQSFFQLIYGFFEVDLFYLLIF